MKLEGKHTFQAPQERVWDLLTQRAHLEKALPGCQKLEEREPGKKWHSNTPNGHLSASYLPSILASAGQS